MFGDTRGFITNSLALAPPETFGSAPWQKARWPTWIGSMHLPPAGPLDHCNAKHLGMSTKGVGANDVSGKRQKVPMTTCKVLTGLDDIYTARI